MVQVSAVLICSSSRATFATKIQSKGILPIGVIFFLVLGTDKDTCLVVRSLSLSTIRSCKTRHPESKSSKSLALYIAQLRSQLATFSPGSGPKASQEAQPR